ncbi:hypothetical protein GTP45_20370 [Pseudoduganella sp. FT55W]|uniref:Uncharacterized protein n=1 Tax=Duganella rivi TaxID=2666083 RepID=A0A7X4KDG0_9BURK|nr:hypothetical protein [Duganella rivi]MYM69175.1 hypothetical protein [Duganella rivi]
MRKRTVLPLLALVAILAVIYTQFTIFIVPPIGSLPTGMTIVFPRLSKTSFIDSPDAICEREMGHVNLLCRGVTLGAVAAKAKIIARLPYSDTLYRISMVGDTPAK